MKLNYVIKIIKLLLGYGVLIIKTALVLAAALSLVCIPVYFFTNLFGEILYGIIASILILLALLGFVFYAGYHWGDNET